MGKNDGALGLFSLDEVTIALLRGIMEMTPAQREKLLKILQEEDKHEQ